jgi:hypothetical protein
MQNVVFVCGTNQIASLRENKRNSQGKPQEYELKLKLVVSITGNPMDFA